MKLLFGNASAILIVFALIFKAEAQELQEGQYFGHKIGSAFLKGFVVPQYEHGRHLTYGRPVGIDFFYSKQTSGKKERERIYGLPSTGFSLTIIDTDMAETGSIFNTAFYMDTYLFKSRAISSYIRLGAGFTYATKIYDRDSNNLNNILSTRISYHALLRLAFEVPINERYFLMPAISWSHTSNGSFSLPNNGINIASFNIGGGYRFGIKKKIKHEEYNFLEKEKGFGINLSFRATGKETEPLGSPKRLYYTLSANIDKTLNKISRVYVGIEAFHNRGLIDIIENEPGVDINTDHRRVGVFLGHELMVSRVSFLSMVGHYIYRPFKGGVDNDPHIYHRHGFKVYLTKKIYTTALMKVHWAQADVFDFGLGVRL